MSIHPPCFICDALTPLYADMLCADHWLLRSVQALVRAGAWSEFDMDAWGKRPNHAMMLLTRDEQEATRRHAWQAVVLAACNTRRVWWDAGSGDTTDSEADRYTAMTGLVAAWVWTTVDDFDNLLYNDDMNTSPEFQTIRIWTRTLRKLRLVAALTGERMVGVLERLVSDELKRVQQEEREREQPDPPQDI